jgi:hypothetical protein
MMGQPMQTPMFGASWRFPKTNADWRNEPLLKPLWEAGAKIWQAEFGNNPYVEWPVKDGDAPNKKGVVPDVNRGHWILRASTKNAPEVKAWVNNQVIDIANPKIAAAVGGHKWGDGDYTAIQVSLAKRANNTAGIRCYLNSVCFTAVGEKLNVGGPPPTDWGQAMASAQAAGIAIRQNAPPAFGTPPQAPGMPPGPQPAAFQPQPGGWSPPSMTQAYTPPQAPQMGPQPGPFSAPGTASGAPAFQAAPGQYGNMGAPNAASPSNQGPPPNPFGGQPFRG